MAKTTPWVREIEGNAVRYENGVLLCCPINADGTLADTEGEIGEPDSRAEGYDEFIAKAKALLADY